MRQMRVAAVDRQRIMGGQPAKVGRFARSFQGVQQCGVANPGTRPAAANSHRASCWLLGCLGGEGERHNDDAAAAADMM